MVANKAGTTPPETFDPTIEELAAARGIKSWVMAGVMRANKWAAGKRMPEADFDKAVDGWLKSPMSGAAPAKPAGGGKG